MNFQKRDSTEESIVALPQLAKPKENQEEDDISDRLSDILAAYGGRKSEEEIQESYHPHQQPLVEMPKASKKPSKEYFIPVDYHTYQKWLHQHDITDTIPTTTTISVRTPFPPQPPPKPPTPPQRPPPDAERYPEQPQRMAGHHLSVSVCLICTCTFW